MESTEKFWEGVYTRNIDKLIGICYRYTGNRQLAEDLAHDAFLKAIAKADSFKGDGPFEAWLRSIVVNHTMTYLRTQKKHRDIDGWFRDENSVVHQDVDNVFGNQSETGLSAQEILSAIDSLPEHHRLVFNLYVIDDFKHAQIAEALGISEGTSKSHLARARKKIRQLLVEKLQRKQGRRDVFLFLLPLIGWSIDRLPSQRFKNFEVAHRIALPAWRATLSSSTRLSYAGAPWSYGITACIAGAFMVVSVLFYIIQQADIVHPIKDELTSSNRDERVDSRIDVGDKYSRKVDRSKKSGSDRATPRGNGVIKTRTVKINAMKKLNSLGAALVTCAGLAFDSAAQSTVSVNASAETFEASSVVQVSPPTVGVAGKQEGTFYATRLYWSGENRELYFKGKVMVDVGENHFVSTGSVNFLGKVYLLLIDDKPVKLDETIRLSEQQYRLAQLDGKEATRKYGEKGKNGAVEIYAVNK